MSLNIKGFFFIFYYYHGQYLPINKTPKQKTKNKTNKEVSRTKFIFLKKKDQNYFDGYFLVPKHTFMTLLPPPHPLIPTPPKEEGHTNYISFKKNTYISLPVNQNPCKGKIFFQNAHIHKTKTNSQHDNQGKFCYYIHAPSNFQIYAMTLCCLYNSDQNSRR